MSAITKAAGEQISHAYFDRQRKTAKSDTIVSADIRPPRSDVVHSWTRARASQGPDPLNSQAWYFQQVLPSQ